jgi:hypothetical protein
MGARSSVASCSRTASPSTSRWSRFASPKKASAIARSRRRLDALGLAEPAPEILHPEATHARLVIARDDHLQVGALVDRELAERLFDHGMQRRELNAGGERREVQEAGPDRACERIEVGGRRRAPLGSEHAIEEAKRAVEDAAERLARLRSGVALAVESVERGNHLRAQLFEPTVGCAGTMKCRIQSHRRMRAGLDDVEHARRQRDHASRPTPEHEELIGMHHEHGSIELRGLPRGVVRGVKSVVHAVERAAHAGRSLGHPAKL